MTPTSKPAVTPEMVEKAEKFCADRRAPIQIINGVTHAIVSPLVAEFAASAVQDAVRECIMICEAVADNLATFHSTMPAGARQCAAALREKYGVKP